MDRRLSSVTAGRRSLVLISCSPAGTIRRTAIPTLRALGPARFFRMLDRAFRYLVWWSWQRDGESKTLARYITADA
jgi:hypothetical protein